MEDSECSCEKCNSACRNKAGWFVPEEIPRLAKFFGVTEPELFKTHLAVDWWEPDADFKSTVFLLAPANSRSTPGEMYSGNPHGQCIFYDQQKGQCKIHEVKPFECRKYLHDQTSQQIHPLRVGVVKEWVKHQKKITALLGYEPYADSAGFLDSLQW